MEFIALILFIVVIAASSGKGKKNRQAQAGQRSEAGRRLQANSQPQAPRGRGSVPSDVREMLNQFSAAQDAVAARVAQPTVAVPRTSKTAQMQPAPEGESMLADEDCFGGSMPHVHAEGESALVDEDCFGGSMPHRHTQGVDRKSQNRRMAGMDEKNQNAEPSGQHLAAFAVADIDAQAMRQAVVMSEVLGKPRSMRRR